MAEIQSQPRGRGRRNRRRSNVNVKPDMTAMVDVAFLLLTFFILVGVIAADHYLGLHVPPKGRNISMQESKILTLHPLDHGQVAYYIGEPKPENPVHLTDFGPEGLRQVLIQHLEGPGALLCADLAKAERSGSGCWDPIVLIKPAPKSPYGAFVKTIDELEIVHMPKHSLGVWEDSDRQFLSEAGIRIP